MIIQVNPQQYRQWKGFFHTDDVVNSRTPEVGPLEIQFRPSLSAVLWCTNIDDDLNMFLHAFFSLYTVNDSASQHNPIDIYQPKIFRMKAATRFKHRDAPESRSSVVAHFWP